MSDGHLSRVLSGLRWRAAATDLRAWVHSVAEEGIAHALSAGRALGFGRPFGILGRGAERLKVLIKSAWGSADRPRAAVPFHHANAFAEAGHEVQIFLLGEAVSLMRAVVAGSVVPVGWAPLSDALAKVVDHRVPIHV